MAQSCAAVVGHLDGAGGAEVGRDEGAGQKSLLRVVLAGAVTSTSENTERNISTAWSINGCQWPTKGKE